MNVRDIFLGVLVAFIWGANFVAAKYGMQHFPPFLLTALRFTLVALVLLPFVKRPNKAAMKKILLLSTVLGTGHFGFMIAGVWHKLDIATTAITAQLGVPIACILSAVFFKDKIGMWRSLGLLIAFTGIFIVVGTPKVADNFTGFLMVLFGAMGFAGSTIIMRGMKDIAIFPVLAWMSLLSVPQILLISLLLEENHWQLLSTIPVTAMLSLAYSALLSTVVAYGLWYHLMKKYEVSQVSPFSLLAPVFAIISGQVIFAENVSTQTLIGGIIVIIGVAIIVFRRPRLGIIGER